MFSYKRSAAIINLDNAAFNLQNIRRKINKNTKIMSVIKADAYGHGALEYANICLENHADYLAVAATDEAFELRENAINAKILLLGYNNEEDFEKIIKEDIMISIFSLDTAKKYNELARKLAKDVYVHIKLETGMSRIGFTLDEKSVEEIKEISKMSNIKIDGIYTHLASADEKDKTYSYMQKENFLNFLSKLSEENINYGLKHISNSAAIIDMDDFNLDLVRPGIMQYGLYPSSDIKKENIELKAVMEFKTKLSHIKTLSKGMPISYGRTYVLEKDTLVGTVPIGYADGISRLLSSKGRVLINGEYANILGRVCMDQFMLDLSNAKNAKVGDEIVIFGKQGSKEIPVEEIAKLRDTINYEVVCNVARRIPRIYIKDNKIISDKNYLLKKGE